MNREQKFWSAVYNVISETSHLVDIGALTNNDYSMVMKALSLSIAQLRERQKEEEEHVAHNHGVDL